MIAFDHIAVVAATLEAGADHVRRGLRVEVGPGGTHALMGTHNRLCGLGDDQYLEVIAIDPDVAGPGRPRWFDLDRREGPPRIGNWIARTADLDTLVARYPQAGRPVSFKRGNLRWRMALPDDGILPFDGCFPALIEWQSAPPSFPETGMRLASLILHHPEAPRLADVLSGLIDDPRIRIETGPAALEAEIVTPGGMRRLA